MQPQYLLSRWSPLRSLWRHPQATRNELEALQTRQLRYLLTHAYTTVPYYHRLFKRHGIAPQDIRSVADLTRVPVTAKQDLQLLPVDEVVSCQTNPARLIVRKTSGSTGMPFRIRRTWLEERLLGAFRWRALHDMGLRVRDRHAEIEEVEPVDPHDRQLLHRSFQRMGLYRQQRVHALQAPREIVSQLRRFDPQVITGYSGVLARVAQCMSDADRRALRPRFLVGHSDVLTPHMRWQITSAFSAPVFEIYDSNECNLIAWQCRETGELHTCDDTTIVEVITKDGRPATPGERGEVVLTALHSFAMPFIRFRLGDIVTKGDSHCACGQPFATIHSVQGRMFDYFPLSDGRLVHPYEIIAILSEHAPWIREYQLTQKRKDLVVLSLVPASSPSPPEVERLQMAIATFLGQQVVFTTEIVPEIQLEPSGKFRVCRSFVHSAYDEIKWSAP